MTKLTYNIDNTTERRQILALTRALLLANPGKNYSGMDAALECQARYGIHIDHHIFTSVMDAMTRTSESVCTQGWGETRYTIQPTTNN